MLTTTPATLILSHVFGAYCMTRIVYKYISSSNTHSLSIVTSRENTLTLSISTNKVNSLFLLFTFDFEQSTATKMYTLCNDSLPCYTLSVRLFPASNTKISSHHRKKQTTNMGEDTFLLTYIIKIL